MSVSRSAFSAELILSLCCDFSCTTHLFALLDKLAKLLDHLRHEDDVHLVGEVGSIDGVNQQAPSHGHHAALV